MGFFTNRKADSSSLALKLNVGISTEGQHEQSVVQTLRARLNGRKRRRAQPSSATGHASSVDSTGDLSLHVLGNSCFDSADDNQSQVPRRPGQLESRMASTDPITMTLANRLNELASANADGLLDDDEYRALRQSLFKSFASVSSPPSEAPVVKSVEPNSRLSMSVTESARDHVIAKSTGAPSLRTQASNVSTISSLFQRVWRRTPAEEDGKPYDQVSILSSSSRIPFSPSTASTTHALSRQTSSSSLKVTHSRNMPSDVRSLSSRRSNRSIRTNSDAGGMSRGSTRSLRSKDPPPSSFTAKHLISPILFSASTEDRLRSAADIRAEILATEAEEQRLFAAFSVLARQSLDTASIGQVPDSWTFVRGQFPSTSEVYSDRKHLINRLAPADSELIVDEMPLVHRGHDLSKTRYRQLGYNAGIQADELDRKREEVIVRYQQRLDYLRARLKGAEIHERLLRK